MPHNLSHQTLESFLESYSQTHFEEGFAIACGSGANENVIPSMAAGIIFEEEESLAAIREK